MNAEHQKADSPRESSTTSNEAQRNEINRITGQIIGAAMKVHSALGPGLLESAYEKCLAFDLCKRGLNVETQVVLPLQYGDLHVDAGYRIDLLVEGAVIVELKAVEHVSDVHRAQLLSYVKLSKNPVGLLINFNVLHLKDGITRFVTEDY